MKKIVCMLLLASLCFTGCFEKVEDVPQDNNEPTVETIKSSNEKQQYFLDKLNEIKNKEDAIYSDYSLSQVEINASSEDILKDYDNLLNDVYAYLKENMSKAEFEKLRQDELKWIAEKEKAIEEEGKLWEGGSGEAMARNAMGTRYTSRRCKYLIGLLKDLKYSDAPYVVDTVSPTGFAGSSLNQIKLFSNGDTYWIQYDGAGFEEENIIKNELVAKNAEDVTADEETVLVTGVNIEKVLEETVPWLSISKTEEH